MVACEISSHVNCKFQTAIHACFLDRSGWPQRFGHKQFYRLHDVITRLFGQGLYDGGVVA